MPFGADFIDIVDADARADDDFKFARHAGGVDLRLAYFCGAADDERVVILNGFAKRVRFVKLNVYLTAFCFQSGNRALFHAVAGENFNHDRTPFPPRLRVLRFELFEERNQRFNAFLRHGVIDGSAKSANALVSLEVVIPRLLCGGDDFRVQFRSGGDERNVHQRAAFRNDGAAEHLAGIEKIIQNFCFCFVDLLHGGKPADLFEILKDLAADVDCPAVRRVVH
ncbi:hypothetical protein SDC9_181997 [bioreactor metagenome]|uniref:Uncharacterized protein n=1 Tax=bioreactor metagenome TaxID=1076179 RepID=A0A645HFQ4_9ZZZZ